MSAFVSVTCIWIGYAAACRLGVYRACLPLCLARARIWVCAAVFCGIHFMEGAPVAQFYLQVILSTLCFRAHVLSEAVGQCRPCWGWRHPATILARIGGSSGGILDSLWVSCGFAVKVPASYARLPWALASTRWRGPAKSISVLLRLKTPFRGVFCRELSVESPTCMGLVLRHYSLQIGGRAHDVVAASAHHGCAVCGMWDLAGNAVYQTWFSSFLAVFMLQLEVIFYCWQQRNLGDSFHVGSVVRASTCTISIHGASGIFVKHRRVKSGSRIAFHNMYMQQSRMSHNNNNNNNAVNTLENAAAGRLKAYT